MKSTYIYILVLIAAFSSCSYLLDEDPKIFVDPNSFYQNETECSAAVNYLYYPLYRFYKIDLLYVTDLSTDLSYFGSGNTDPVNTFAISPAQPGSAATNSWTACYSGITQSNNTINGIASAPIDGQTKSKLIAEASFLRGFYYYILTEVFNDVPFFFDTVLTREDQDRIAKIPRMSAAETRNSVIKDLESKLDFLSIKQPSDASFQRVSKQAAYMLIAKMAMKNRDYSLAKKYLLMIKDIYGALDASKYPLTDTYLSKKNTPESIFEVQYNYDPTGIQRSAGVAAYTTPRLSTPNTDIFDGVSISFIGTTATTNASAIPSNYLIKLYNNIKGDLDPALSTDLRYDIILAYSYNGQIFNRVQSGGKPWFGIKFWAPNMVGAADGNNQRVFRYADALLMLAECYNEGDDRNPNEALKVLEEIRKRAGYISFFTNTDKKALLKEIQDERGRELFGEYQRKFDLVRWGIYYEQVKNNAEESAVFTNIRPYHRYLPIPDSEVLRTNGILTNEDYQ